MNTIWIDPEILSWNRYVSTWSTAHAGREKRSYAHWNHAERLIRNGCDELSRGDVVAALKRAVSFRAELIHEIWRLKSIPLPDAPGNMLERMAHYGIIRPRQLRRLIDIRNAVEHEDSPPPDAEACENFLDVVWYFLRSTDALITKTTDSVYLTPNDPSIEDFRGTLQGGPEHDWTLLLDLRLEAHLVSNSARSGWVAVSCRRNPFVAMISDDVAAELGVRPRVPSNSLDTDSGFFELYGIIVGHTEHIQRAVELLLTPF